MGLFGGSKRSVTDVDTDVSNISLQGVEGPANVVSRGGQVTTVEIDAGAVSRAFSAVELSGNLQADTAQGAFNQVGDTARLALELGRDILTDQGELLRESANDFADRAAASEARALDAIQTLNPERTALQESNKTILLALGGMAIATLGLFFILRN